MSFRDQQVMHCGLFTNIRNPAAVRTSQSRSVGNRGGPSRARQVQEVETTNRLWEFLFMWETPESGAVPSTTWMAVSSAGLWERIWEQETRKRPFHAKNSSARGPVPSM